MPFTLPSFYPHCKSCVVHCRVAKITCSLYSDGDRDLAGVENTSTEGSQQPVLSLQPLSPFAALHCFLPLSCILRSICCSARDNVQSCPSDFLDPSSVSCFLSDCVPLSHAQLSLCSLPGPHIYLYDLTVTGVHVQAERVFYFLILRFPLPVASPPQMCQTRLWRCSSSANMLGSSPFAPLPFPFSPVSSQPLPSSMELFPAFLGSVLWLWFRSLVVFPGQAFTCSTCLGLPLIYLHTKLQFHLSKSQLRACQFLCSKVSCY